MDRCRGDEHADRRDRDDAPRAAPCRARVQDLLQSERAEDRDGEQVEEQDPLVLHAVEQRQVDDRVVDARRSEPDREPERPEQRERRLAPPAAGRQQRDDREQQRRRAGVEGALAVVRRAAFADLARPSPPVGEQRRAQHADRHVGAGKARPAVAPRGRAGRVQRGLLGRQQRDRRDQAADDERRRRPARAGAAARAARSPRLVAARASAYSDRGGQHVQLRAGVAAREDERDDAGERDPVDRAPAPQHPLDEPDRPRQQHRDGHVRAEAEPDDVERAEHEGETGEDPGRRSRDAARARAGRSRSRPSTASGRPRRRARS